MEKGRLTKESRNKIRKAIIEQLKEVPEGEKIKLDIKLLDDLIFFKYYNEEMRQQLKIPIWTGEFLRKIDLSELSFENAIINGFVQDRGQEKEYIDPILKDYIDEYSIKEYIKEYKECNDEKLIKSRYTSDFSYTDINPDFSKSTRNDIEWCNLEGVDLSNSNNDGFSYCNLQKTNLKIKKSNDYEYLYECDLSYNDFKNITVDARDIMNEDRIYNCDFANTGLNIAYKFDLDENSKHAYEEFIRIDGSQKQYIEKFHEKEQICKNYGNPMHHDDEIYYAEKLKELIEMGYLDGCYLNGKLIDSKKYEKDLIKQITTSIEEQKNKFKK